MKFVVLGGTGTIGKYVVKDLYETCKNCEIIIASSDGTKARKYAKLFNNKKVKGEHIDVKNVNKTAELLKGADVAINCVNYYFNLDVMRACLQAGINYVDLGGLFHFTKKQLKLNSKFKQKGIIAILGCGSTPGITNVMARYGADLLDKINEIKIRFAGKDYTKYNMPFVVPYTMHTVFDEFTMKPAIFTKGRLKMIAPSSSREKEVFPQPVGEVTCFATLHSELATFPHSFRNKGIKECSFKLAFPEEFVDKVVFLVKTGFADKKHINVKGCAIKPRDFTVTVLNNLIPSSDVKVKDLEFVRVELIGIKKGKKKRIIIDCLTKSNPKWNASAGIVDTAIPPSIIAQMIVKKMVDKKGVMAPENCIDYSYFFKELSKRKIQISVSIKENKI